MILPTKDQLAKNLDEAYLRGYQLGFAWGHNQIPQEKYKELSQRDLLPILHRSSGGHDDHGREVKP
ncbi:hypothetical protein [Pseudomonas oryzihabitans]|uniref:hypothetical protein n=1 Tax=Pseudomonas oryzihabitans TaxID=47885 RepID=UPI0009441294|nr:hypothetical protein [Pseudomonas psychrotolerans]NMY89803.1 hypothetical protein [Pseudomonas psychrotolerans]